MDNDARANVGPQVLANASTTDQSIDLQALFGCCIHTKAVNCIINVVSFLDLNLKILQKIEQLDSKVDATALDVRRLKAALIKKTDTSGTDQLFHMDQFKTDDDFTLFCDELHKDENFRELYVSFTAFVNS